MAQRRPRRSPPPAEAEGPATPRGAEGSDPTSRWHACHDREVLGALLAAQRPRLMAVALRLCRDPDAAEDVVQNACLKVVRHAGRFRGEARWSTWLHRIVVNEALMWLRSQGRRGRGLAEAARDAAALPDPAPDAAEALEQRRRLRRLARALTELSAPDRDALWCCVVEGTGYAAYAAGRGQRPSAAKSRVHRARARLRARLAETEAARPARATA